MLQGPYPHLYRRDSAPFLPSQRGVFYCPQVIALIFSCDSRELAGRR